MCVDGSVAVTSTLPTPPPRHVAAAARVRDVPGAGGRPAPARAHRGAPQQEVEHGQLLGPPQQTRLRERGRGRRGGPSPGGVHHENIPYGQSSAKLPVILSPSYLIIQSFSHLVTLSLAHLVTWSLRSLGHLVTQSLGHYFHH